MRELLEQLHDIEGLDPITVWPLAIGWWALIALAIFFLGLMIVLIYSRIAFKRSWKNDTFKKLALLEKNLSDATARQALMALSEYLRRIVLRRFPRKSCASLMGESWLRWLTENDPKNFNWEKEGVLLIHAPYAPMDQNPPVGQIKKLIHAVKEWVR